MKFVLPLALAIAAVSPLHAQLKSLAAPAGLGSTPPPRPPAASRPPLRRHLSCPRRLGPHPQGPRGQHLQSRRPLRRHAHADARRGQHHLQPVPRLHLQRSVLLLQRDPAPQRRRLRPPGLRARTPSAPRPPPSPASPSPTATTNTAESAPNRATRSTPPPATAPATASTSSSTTSAAETSAASET